LVIVGIEFVSIFGFGKKFKCFTMLAKQCLVSPKSLFVQHFGSCYAITALCSEI
jgi:hypothetical protein